MSGRELKYDDPDELMQYTYMVPNEQDETRLDGRLMDEAVRENALSGWVCPHCTSRDVVPDLYAMPLFDENGRSYEKQRYSCAACWAEWEGPI